MVDAPRDDSAATGTQRPIRPERAGEGAIRPERASDAAPEDGDEDGATGPDLDPRRAFEVLEIRTPLEEFESYVRARIDTLSRLGEKDRADLAGEALELGRRALARVTGTPLKDGPAASPHETGK